jgi:phage-related protein
MNDKDKEAFDKWFIEKYRYDYNRLVVPESINPQKEAWQAACEYKEAENKKLREALEFYADPNSWIWTKLNYDQIISEDADYVLSHSADKVGGRIARQTLSEYRSKKEWV